MKKFKCQACGKTFEAEGKPECCPKCGDGLDTDRETGDNPPVFVEVKE